MSNKITIYKGNTLVIRACYFEIPGWTEKHPTILYIPNTSLIIISNKISGADHILTDFIEDLICSGEYEFENNKNSIDDSLKWIKTSWKTLENKINKSIEQETKLFKDRFSEIIEVKIEITQDENGFDWEEIYRIEI